MPKAKRCFADVSFQFWTFQVARNDLSTDKRAKSSAVADLATKLNTCQGGLLIIWVTEIIPINLHGFGGIGTGDTNTTATLGLNHVPHKNPTACGKAKFCGVLSA
jgi:hypothetical protein